MYRTLCILVCSLLFIFLNGQEAPCPKSYPSSCKCYPNSKWVNCKNMQSTTHFPRGIFDNDTQWLSLEKSSIKNLTKEDFINLSALTKLGMTEGKIDFIDEGTFQQLVNLTEVNLKDNMLDSFMPGVFTNLAKLEKVRLDKNPFTVLPDGMFKNSPLKMLFIQNSKLNSTGLNGIGSGRVAKTISELHLDYSNLRHLAREQFSGLLSLAQIGLTQCNVQYVHTDFLKGTKVKSVNLYGNNIVKIDPDAMRGDQIDSFKCRYCDLTTYKVFGKDSFLPQMTSLKLLDLGHNEISHIPKDAFKGLSKITSLLLFYNNISTIEENPFTTLNDLHSFAIQQNPFKCDCHLAWFHKYALAEIGKALTGEHVLKEMICASPSNLAGKKFPDLKDSQFCCGAVSSSSRVCGKVGSKGTTIRPTSGMFALPPVFVLMFYY